jgi:acetoin utilization deacetylase AcuC-like enzyme
LKNLHIAYDPIYAHPLPEGHRFPMLKYELIPAQLLHEGVITNKNLISPTICTEDVLLLTHTSEYIHKVQSLLLTDKEQRAIGFPQSEILVIREKMIAQGTIDCALAAIENGVALNIAGGTHHSFTNKGEGFCIFNDIAVAANYLLKKGLAKNILIVDLDVHQGNGTAEIFKNNNNVFTCSMHGATNYPFRKEISDVDIGLLDGTDDVTYLQLLQFNLLIILKENTFDFVFYLSGVDVLATDKFGKLKLTIEGCKQRDKFVFDSLKNSQLPCAVSMGGGYSPLVKTIVEAHCNTFKVAKDVWGL